MPPHAAQAPVHGRAARLQEGAVGEGAGGEVGGRQRAREQVVVQVQVHQPRQVTVLRRQRACACA